MPKSVQGLIRKRATKLGAFIKDNLGDIHGESSVNGTHSITGIHDLKSTWQHSIANASSQ